MRGYDIGLCSFDDGDDCATTPMSVLVEENGVYLTGKHSFIDAVALTDILGKQHPFLCVPGLVPSGEIAEFVLVIALHRTALHVEELGYGSGCHREVIEDLL